MTFTIGAIREILQGPFNVSKGQFVNRPFPVFAIHLVLACFSALVMTITMTSSWWLIFTRWNTIISATGFFSINLIPTTLLVATMLPRNTVPTLWVIGLGIISSAVAFLVNILFILMFTAAAWGSGIYHNTIIDQIYQESHALMLAIWFLACTVAIVSLAIQTLFWASYIFTFAYSVSLLGTGSRIGESIFRRIWAGTPVIGL